MTVAFTGHRTVTHANAVYEQLQRMICELIQQGADTFICGGAVGFDTLAAEVVLLLRKQYPIRLVLAIPCADQDAKFTPKQRELYAKIRAAADEEIVLSPRYVQGCMHHRNRYMVDRCDFLVAYCHKKVGGTAYTVDYAEKKNKRVLNLC